MNIAIVKQWCADVKGLRDMLCFLSLSETGLYEHELMQLLQVSTLIEAVFVPASPSVQHGFLHHSTTTNTRQACVNVV